jgi:arylsulfatase A-like enzyme
MAYSHNLLANTLLKQFLPAIDDFTPQRHLFLGSDTFLYDLLENDDDIGPTAWSRIIKQEDDGLSYSLLLSRLYAALAKKDFSSYKEKFPRGVPNMHQDYYFLLEDAINWLQTLLVDAPQPFMGYFHFMPPHFPYNTRIDFYNQFLNDGFTPPKKPDHIMTTKRSEGRVDEFRRWYDEYILYVDYEFARLYHHLEVNKILKNTWLILTSDHGEVFERGIVGHQALSMFQPHVRIPLVIFAPDQSSRVDIFEKTNAIDLLPTMMYITGKEIPDWAEGDILPPYRSSPLPSDRPIVTLRGRGIEEGQPIHKGSAMLIRGDYKLVYIFGFVKDLDGGELIELYNLKDDPEELSDLATSRPDIVNDMLMELKTNLARTS